MKDIKVIEFSFCSYKNLMPTTFPLIFLFNITSFSCRSVRPRKKGEKTYINTQKQSWISKQSYDFQRSNKHEMNYLKIFIISHLEYICCLATIYTTYPCKKKLHQSHKEWYYIYICNMNHLSKYVNLPVNLSSYSVVPQT